MDVANLSFLKPLRSRLNNLTLRRAFVEKELKKIPPGLSILDAGCGSQQFRTCCNHLTYKAQDFAAYNGDRKKSLGTDGLGGESGADYIYGPLDYLGDIWDIDEKDEEFDYILCTEVFEHIPYPIETLEEFSRLLKKGGTLILTAPGNSLRHMDPYFFYSGFSDRWYEKFLEDFGFEIISILPVGDYYSWMATEIARSIRHKPLSGLLLLPAFLYFFLKKPSERSINTLCEGYHVVAKKIDN